MSSEIISEIILIVAIFVIGGAIVLWSVADGVSGARLKQRNAASPDETSGVAGSSISRNH